MFKILSALMIERCQPLKINPAQPDTEVFLFQFRGFELESLSPLKKKKCPLTQVLVCFLINQLKLRVPLLPSRLF